jgi:hypothetical protein
VPRAWVDALLAAGAMPAWDRLVYPLHDVESYLKARIPRDLSTSASRLPSTRA